MQTIFVIAGPTNAGKDTVMHALLPRMELNLARVITSTSRKIRPGEMDGIDYHFYSKEEFEEKIQNNEFFEYSLVHTDYKGVEKNAIYNNISKNKNIIFQLDIQGFEKVNNMIDKDNYKVVGIFIYPPTMDELKRRMHIRATETDPKDIEARLNSAKYEIEHKDVFDYSVINDNLEMCVEEISNIIKENSII